MRGGDGFEYELGRTEVIMNTQDPEWAKPVIADYHPGEEEVLKVEVTQGRTMVARINARSFA